MPVDLNSNQLRQNIKRMIAKKVPQPSDQDDITQDVYLKILKYAKTEEPGLFFGWLKQTVRSSVADFYRRRPDNRALPEDVPVFYEEEDEDYLAELECCVEPFLGQMDPELADLVRRIDLWGENQTQVADELGVNYSTLKTRLQKARRELLQLLKNCCKDGNEPPC